MSDFVPLFDAMPSNSTVDIEFFDPPMCCPTGICGPTIDQALLDLNEMILALQNENFLVARYQMTTHPNAFLSNSEVMKLVREQQIAALPITVVQGKVIKTGTYPTLTEIKANLNGDIA